MAPRNMPFGHKYFLELAIFKKYIKALKRIRMCKIVNTLKTFGIIS